MSSSKTRQASRSRSSSSKKITVPPGCWNNFRMNGIRPAKSLVGTVADIAGDWWFYISVRDNTDPDEFGKYVLPLFVFAVVSACMGLVLVISLLYNASRQQAKKKLSINGKTNRNTNAKIDRFGQALKWTLGMEIIVESIPQFILTSMISIQRGGITPQGVFNVTTSGMNFLLNLLDMIEIEHPSANHTNDDENDPTDGDPTNSNEGGNNLQTTSSIQEIEQGAL